MAAALLAAILVSALISPPVASAEPRDEVASFAHPSNELRQHALIALLQRYKLSYALQEFLIEGRAEGPKTGTNIIVDLGSGSRDILLTAHYDAAVQESDGKLARGLVDNAASVVGLVRTADRVKKLRLKHRVRLVFFDAEEIGHRGSRAYIEKGERTKIAAVVNFDVNAYGDTAIFHSRRDSVDRPLVAAVKRACGQGFDCVALAKFPSSDHEDFQAVGVPATNISFFPAKEAHQLWLAFNGGPDSGLAPGFKPRIMKMIHTPEDNIDNVSSSTIDRMSDLAVEVVRQLDRQLSR